MERLLCHLTQISMYVYSDFIFKIINIIIFGVIFIDFKKLIEFLSKQIFSLNVILLVNKTLEKSKNLLTGCL